MTGSCTSPARVALFRCRAPSAGLSLPCAMMVARIDDRRRARACRALLDRKRPRGRGMGRIDAKVRCRSAVRMRCSS